MVAEPVAVIREVNDIGVLGQTSLLERDHQAPDLMVDQRDLSIGVGDDLSQLVVGLLLDTAVGLAQLGVLLVAHRFLSQHLLVPPGAAFKCPLAMPGQVDLGRVVQTRPRLGAVERVMRVGKADPGAERLVAVLLQPFDRPIGSPGRVVPRRRQARMPGLRGAMCVARVLPVELDLLVTLPVRMKPSFIVLAGGRFLGREPVVAHQHDLEMLEAHVGSEPVRPVGRRGFQALGRAGLAEGVVGREMRLAEERGVIARRRQRPGKSLLADGGIQVDAVVVDPVGTRQLAGQDRGPRGLADHAGRDRSGETGSLPRKLVQMRRLDCASLDTKTVTPLLVGRDQQEIRTGHVLSPIWRREKTTTTAMAAIMKTIARGLSKRNRGLPPVAE